MAIKNYTTKVDIFTSLGEIQGALAKNGALKIMTDYADGKPVSISFATTSAGSMRGFTLPAPVEGTLRAFQKQKIKADRKQAEMTAWRNVRDWILAQMALVESCDVPVDQVFLPYLSDNTGRTLYEVYQSGRLLIGDGQAED